MAAARGPREDNQRGGRQSRGPAGRPIVESDRLLERFATQCTSPSSGKCREKQHFQVLQMVHADATRSNRRAGGWRHRWSP
jgi:hypothetical protein